MQDSGNTGGATAADITHGTGYHPAYHALWHLHALGVVTDLETYHSDYWPDAQKVADEDRVRVAIIDTPVAYHHPNLDGVIDLALMRDFSVHDEGVFVVTELSDADAARRKAFADRIGKTPSPAEAAFLAAVTGKDHRPAAEPRFFGAHGTAVAGLIGGRPAQTKGLSADWTGDLAVSVTVPDELALPYAGINPYCRIIPISTTAAPEPSMVLAALEYALFVEAEIVVIAAAWEDNAQYALDRAKWAPVNAALDRLSKTAVVLCAAGNSGKTELAYPALRGAKDGPIVVTACDAAGDVMAYSPDQSDGQWMIKTLSSAAPRYDSEMIIHDHWAVSDPEIVSPAGDPTMSQGKRRALPVEALVSLDVPGPYGYNPSPFRHTPVADGPHFDFASLYCRFSGSSAATAVAAGLISLARQVRKAKGSATGQLNKPDAGWTPDGDLFTIDKAANI